MRYNVVIIGAGPGGYETALYASKHNLNVCLIEESHLGGTCLNEGCIPTKALVHATSVYNELVNNKVAGVKGNVSFDHFAFQEYKNGIIRDFSSGIEQLLKIGKVEYKKGRGSLVDNHHVKVNDEIIETDYIILACGSRNNDVDFGVETLNSSSLLSSCLVKNSLAIIGGGVIGLEFASIYASLGVKVTVIEKKEQILSGIDEGSVKALRVILKKKGVDFLTGVGVTSISKDIDYTIKLDNGNELHSEYVMQCLGRLANVEDINLSNVGVFYDKKGVKVTKDMQTSIDNIYCIGDMNGLNMTAPAATVQGKIAINHILNIKVDYDFDNYPRAIFTTPVLASIGKSEEKLKEEGIEYKAIKVFMLTNGYAKALNETEGNAKILLSKDGHVLGSTILSVDAQELIHEVQLVIKNNNTIEELSNLIHIHPSLSEIFTELEKR